MRSALPLAVSALLACAVLARAGDPPAAAPSAGVAFEPGAPAFADVLAKAKAAGKPVFIDFFTQSCGWCKQLDRDVFSKAQTAETMKSFICVRVDACDGEGVDLAKRYHVSAYPTLVVVDAGGAVIDRIFGYEALGEFNEDMKRILRGEGTLEDVRKRYAEKPDDPELAFEYGEKLVTSDAATAAKLLALAISSKKTDPLTVARARLARIEALSVSKQPQAAFGEAETLLAEKRADCPPGLIVSQLYFAFHGIEPDRALRLLDAAAAQATTWNDLNAIRNMRIDVQLRFVVDELRQRVATNEIMTPENPNKPINLANAAWCCLQMRRNIPQATEWARAAIAGCPHAAKGLEGETLTDEPAYIDVLANLLWLQDKRDEALKLEISAAEKATGAAKREFAGTVAKWKLEIALAKGDPEESFYSEDWNADYDPIRGVTWMK
jgi:thiol-disulfide isomerase/thioredoxin